MNVEFKPPKTVVTVTSKPEVGSYALPVDSELQWLKCRETFANHFDETLKGFYFSHQKDGAENVAQFIARTEEIIGVTQIASYAKTNRNWVMWIEPNEFWCSCMMRRSLFTILLRCGLAYEPEKDNYEYSLYSQPYIKDTKEAVMRFLFGFTKYIQKGCFTKGWVTAFKTLDRDAVRGQLVLPEGAERISYTLGINSLWA